MEFKRFRPNDPPRLPADQVNAWTDAAIAHRERVQPNGHRFPALPHAADVITVRNVSTDDVERYRVMTIKAPTVLPADNADEFDRRIVLDLETPKRASIGLWCVLLDSIPKDQFGRAIINGVAIAQVNVVAKTDRTVEIADGSTVLKSGTSGSGELLWVDGGVGAAKATGEQRALIRLPGAPPARRWIKVTSNKGASGIYGAKTCWLKPTWIWPTGGGVVDPADVFDVAPEEDCLYFNQPELFGNPISHWVPTDSFIFASTSREPNNLNLPTFTDNYAKAIRGIRLNEAETWIQITYSNNPSESDWINAIAVGDCDEGA